MAPTATAPHHSLRRRRIASVGTSAVLATLLAVALVLAAPAGGAAAPADRESDTSDESAQRSAHRTALTGFAAAQPHRSSLALDAAADAEHRALTGQSLTARQTTPDCLDDTHDDTLAEVPALDMGLHGALSNCDTIAFLTLTADEWSNDALSSFIVYLDTDADPNTSCFGDEFAIVALDDEANGLIATAISTPTCDNATWSPVTTDAVVSRTDLDDIGIIIGVDQLPINGTFRWALGLTAAGAGTTDFAPDTGSHTAALGTAPPLPANLRCQGMPVTIVAAATGTTWGTPGNDVIMGTNGPDLIRARGGNDRICARGGNDEVDGGTGNDRIDLGGGSDLGVGAAGNDRIDGRAGNDRINGGGGRDIVNGHSGRDRLDGASGDDVVRGHGGRDILGGGGGNDLLDGGAANDRCRPGPGRDRVRRC